MSQRGDAIEFRGLSARARQGGPSAAQQNGISPGNSAHSISAYATSNMTQPATNFATAHGVAPVQQQTPAAVAARDPRATEATFRRRHAQFLAICTRELFPF